MFAVEMPWGVEAAFCAGKVAVRASSEAPKTVHMGRGMRVIKYFLPVGMFKSAMPSLHYRSPPPKRNRDLDRSHEQLHRSGRSGEPPVFRCCSLAALAHKSPPGICLPPRIELP